MIPSKALILLVAAGLFGQQAPVVWRASLRSIGPIRIGMRTTAAFAAVDAAGHPDADISSECDYVELPGVPKELSFMISYGRIVRYEVRGPGFKTASGAEVGMSEDSVKHLYAGHIRVVPDPYSGPEWHNLIYQPSPADSNYGLIFETDGKKILSYRGGRRPHVEYIEGCS